MMAFTTKSAATNKVYRYLAIILGIVVFSLSLIYLYSAVRDNWQSCAANFSRIRIPVLLSALAVLLAAYLYEPLIWQTIVKRLGFPFTALQATAIFYLSCLAMYLPVKAVDLVGRLMLLKKAGVPNVAGGASVFIENWFSFAAALMLSVYFPLVRLVALFPALGPYCLVLWGLSAACIAGLALAALTSGARLIRHFFPAFPASSLSLPAAFLCTVFANFLFLRIISGCAFYLCLGSIVPFTSVNLYEAVGIQSLSWIVSLVAFFVPKGLAVREAFIVSVLGPATGVAPTITAVLMYRLCAIFYDLALGVFGFFVTGGNELRMTKLKK
jgi:uncharacterized membrane protein YbhN (UPF0104 family)